MKKHFIFLGTNGLIYYSWLFIILFMSIIFQQETSKNISLACIVLESIFIISLIYTLLFSYIECKNQTYFLKLPYLKKKRVFKPEFINRYLGLSFYKVNVANSNYFIVIVEKRSNA